MKVNVFTFLLILIIVILMGGVGSADGPLVVFGDSNTEGYDGASPWVEYLGIEIVNCAQGAARTDNYTITGDCRRAAHSASRVLIMLGTNDALAFKTADEIAADYATFIRSLHIRPERVVLVAPPDMRHPYNTLDPALHERYEAYQPNAVLSEALALLDRRYAVIWSNTGEAEHWDGIHLTAEQQRQLGECVRAALSGDDVTCQ